MRGPAALAQALLFVVFGVGTYCAVVATNTPGGSALWNAIVATLTALGVAFLAFAETREFSKCRDRLLLFGHSFVVVGATYLAAILWQLV